MKNLEIKERIDSNNKLIEQIMRPNYFTLNNPINELLQENAELQAQCVHEFKNGYCKYCYLEENTNG